MFTGIVEETGQVQSLRNTGHGYDLTVHCKKALEGTRLGDSIATNGVCLTVTRFDSSSFTAGVSPETLERSNLKSLKPGDRVNLERALTPNSRLGGHFVQGHVDCEGTLSQIKKDRETLWITIQTRTDIMRYIVQKGFICLDGASLTVVETGEDWFNVMLVAYTQSGITLSQKKPGDKINLEVDILAKYIEKLMCISKADNQQGVTKLQKKPLDQAFLSENGFFGL